MFVVDSGQQLRHDDPSALKDIIDIVQKKVAGKDENSLRWVRFLTVYLEELLTSLECSSRTRFMIETLVNLKNNRLKRNVTQDQGGEAVERMKKFLSGLSKRKHGRYLFLQSKFDRLTIFKVLAHDALRVSLDDLHSAESKGKWWLVGAAWAGNPLVEARESMAEVQVNRQTTTIVNDSTGDLLKLARKQGMNTDIRRSIFVVLMSSDVSFYMYSTVVPSLNSYCRITLMHVSDFHSST
jgi:nucleolar MIF4G domain-containing protein 1